MTTQITFDCADAHAQAAFWAVVMDHTVEPHHDGITELIDQGVVPEDSPDLEVVDGKRRWREYAATVSADGGTRLLFQVVPEGKTAKNRVHLDVHVDDRAAKVDELLALGATKLWDGQLGPQTWITLADPEGNEFCVA